MRLVVCRRSRPSYRGNLQRVLGLWYRFLLWDLWSGLPNKYKVCGILSLVELSYRSLNEKGCLSNSQLIVCWLRPSLRMLTEKISSHPRWVYIITRGVYSRFFFLGGSRSRFPMCFVPKRDEPIQRVVCCYRRPSSTWYGASSWRSGVGLDFSYGMVQYAVIGCSRDPSSSCQSISNFRQSRWREFIFQWVRGSRIRSAMVWEYFGGEVCISWYIKDSPYPSGGESHDTCYCWGVSTCRSSVNDRLNIAGFFA